MNKWESEVYVKGGNLTAWEQWAVKQNIRHAKEDGADVVVATLHANGYHRVAEAVEQAMKDGAK